MKNARFDPEASAEYLASLAWYQERNAEAAERFRSHVLTVTASIQEAPRQWPLAPRVPSRLGVRRQLLPEFPYSVVYMERDTEILVLAVAHGRRRPGYWRGRVPET